MYILETILSILADLPATLFKYFSHRDARAERQGEGEGCESFSLTFLFLRKVYPMGIYDNATTRNGNRFLILTDTKQAVPKGVLLVVSEAMRKNYEGKEYPVLTLEDEKGNRYDCAAWERDVKEVIHQFGTDTASWNAQGGVMLKLNSSGSRWVLTPAPMEVIEEMVR